MVRISGTHRGRSLASGSVLSGSHKHLLVTLANPDVSLIALHVAILECRLHGGRAETVLLYLLDVAVRSELPRVARFVRRETEQQSGRWNAYRTNVTAFASNCVADAELPGKYSTLIVDASVI